MVPTIQKQKLLIAYNQKNRSPSEKNDIDTISEDSVQDEADMVYKSAQQLGHEVTLLPVQSIQDIFDSTEQQKPDLIFNLCEGYQGDSRHEMHVASIWELLNIPYTGNTALTLGMAQNKILSKRLFESKKITTPAFQIFSSVPDQTYLTFPLIVKPSREDASLGISLDAVVHDHVTLGKQVQKIINKYNQPALVETLIDGRELNISILDRPEPTVIAISEIDFSNIDPRFPAITSYESKWLSDHPLYKQTPSICPAELDPGLELTIRDMALQVYKILGCRDYARIDMRLDQKNHPYVLECNPNPDISEDSGYARAVRASGMSYQEFIQTVIQQTLNRNLNGKD